LCDPDTDQRGFKGSLGLGPLDFKTDNRIRHYSTTPQHVSKVPFGFPASSGGLSIRALFLSPLARRFGLLLLGAAQAVLTLS
jgi:hypothetical protein